MLSERCIPSGEGPQKARFKRAACKVKLQKPCVGIGKNEISSGSMWLWELRSKKKTMGLFRVHRSLNIEV